MTQFMYLVGRCADGRVVLRLPSPGEILVGPLSSLELYSPGLALLPMNRPMTWEELTERIKRFSAGSKATLTHAEGSLSLRA